MQARSFRAGSSFFTAAEGIINIKVSAETRRQTERRPPAKAKRSPRKIIAQPLQHLHRRAYAASLPCPGARRGMACDEQRPPEPSSSTRAEHIMVRTVLLCSALVRRIIGYPVPVTKTPERYQPPATAPRNECPARHDFLQRHWRKQQQAKRHTRLSACLSWA